MSDRNESIFDRITNLESGIGDGYRLPRWRPSVEASVRWLAQAGLTQDVSALQTNSTRDPAMLLGPNSPLRWGIPANRSERKRKPELSSLRRLRKDANSEPQLTEGDFDRLWNEFKNPASAVMAIDVDRLPADAMAFYRPFHFSPHQEWGIYILLAPLLSYCRTLYLSFGQSLSAFTLETLLGCVLFEVFHHEFFHHLTECAATTIEVASASFGPAQPIYSNYWKCSFVNAPGVGPHIDHPLEEALANAYAYNSFSFLSRAQIGYKLLWVRVYQKILEKCWPMEPAGYRSAGRYINAKYVCGAAQLLAMLLSSEDVDPASLMLLAKTVMPNGNSAFLQKADVPTYLVGSDSDLKVFSRLVPAPNETYTTLLWLGDTSPVDQYFVNRKQEEAKTKAVNTPDESQ
jgi:hypothetical protein